MKKMTIFALIMLMSFSSAALAAGKYASVNAAQLLNDYEKTKDNESVLQDAGQGKEQERAKMVEEIRQMKDELSLLTDDSKDRKQDEIDGKIRQLQDFDRDAKRDLNKQRQQMLKMIFTDIDETIKRFGERKGYDFIVNESALVYKNDSIDVTADVLKELNKGYKK